MFHMSFTRSCKLKGTLRLKRDPFWNGLGHYEDDRGVIWDVNMIVRNESQAYVCARVAEGPYYETGVFSTSDGFHHWLPYGVEVVGQKES